MKNLHLDLVAIDTLSSLAIIGYVIICILVVALTGFVLYTALMNYGSLSWLERFALIFLIGHYFNIGRSRKE